MTDSLPSHVSVAVIGGGQAGLSMSYQLKAKGIDHVVLEKNRIAHSWKTQRWDAFCLVTPNWQCQLPGHAYEGADPNGFMVKEEILAYLDAFARKVNAPLREGVEVLSVEKADGPFEITTREEQCAADAVFLATSLYGEPFRPRCAERIPETILQVHSADYRNPAALPHGAVVVVGSGQSGAQIAEDGGLTVIMDLCLKIEHARYAGRMHWLGFNTRRITSVRTGLQ